MTDERPNLTAIRARADAASPGPWHADHDEFGCTVMGDFGWEAPGTFEYGVDSEQGKADAEFVAHARTDVPDLLAEVETWRGIADSLAERLRLHAGDATLYCTVGDGCPVCADRAALAAYERAAGGDTP